MTSTAASSRTTDAPVRKRLRAGTPEPPSGALTLQAITEELRQLREERQQQRQRESEMRAQLQERDALFQRMEERLSSLSGQSLPTLFNPETAREINSSSGNAGLGYKLKPDTFDGSVPLREYLAQFNLIAQANGWEESTRTVALASSLRGKARAVLDGVTEFESIRYSELEARLELRFGEGHMSQTFYTQFTNRRQKPGEDLPVLGADLERLARLAYSECPAEVRDKIACAQFVAALSDGFVKRTLQLEGLTSLRAAIERAMAIKVIQANSFSRKFESRDLGKGRAGNKIKSAGNEKGEKSSANFKKNSGFRTRFGREEKECWQCGAKGHFRSECPSLTAEEKGNSE